MKRRRAQIVHREQSISISNAEVSEFGKKIDTEFSTSIKARNTANNTATRRKSNIEGKSNNHT
jgi:hypothetical protein